MIIGSSSQHIPMPIWLPKSCSASCNKLQSTNRPNTTLSPPFVYHSHYSTYSIPDKTHSNH